MRSLAFKLLVQLGDSGGSDDGGSDEVVLLAPGSGHGGETVTDAFGDRFQALGGVKAPLIDEAPRHGFLSIIAVFRISEKRAPSGY